MKRKYDFTGETKEIESYGRKVVLHRIQAIMDTPNFSIGDTGGWIEKESNLSHYGDCWVSDEATVYDNAHIRDDARITGNAEVSDSAEVLESAYVGGNALVCANAQVSGAAIISGNAVVRGDAKVSGCLNITGFARVCGDAEILDANHILTIHPIGKYNDIITFFRDRDNEISVCPGITNMSQKLQEFITEIEGTSASNDDINVYKAATRLARLQINLMDNTDNIYNMVNAVNSTDESDAMKTVDAVDAMKF